MALFRKKINWDHVKQSESVFPQDAISLFTLQLEDGMGTGWVNKGYKNYEYKKYCPFNILISVDLTDSIAENNPDIGMDEIEDSIKENLTTTGISHMVARLVTEKGLDIEVYVENDSLAIDQLNQMRTDPNRKFSFSFEANKDPKWKAVKELLTW